MLSYWITRTTNGLRKVAAGLRPFSESVWPGVRNDLFVAHESLYEFFSSLCRDRVVIDAGCGTGYGAYHLAIYGAKDVLGIDIDARNIRFAKNHYKAPNLRFVTGDIQQLDPNRFNAEVVVASNSVEHLPNPMEFLRRAVQLVAGGVVVVALPPIFTVADAETHGQIHYHRSNFSVQEWLHSFSTQHWAVSCYAHRVSSPNVHPNFASPFPSKLQVTDFVVEKSSPQDLYDRGAITALFALRACTS